MTFRLVTGVPRYRGRRPLPTAAVSHRCRGCRDATQRSPFIFPWRTTSPPTRPLVPCPFSPPARRYNAIFFLPTNVPLRPPSASAAQAQIAEGPVDRRHNHHPGPLLLLLLRQAGRPETFSIWPVRGSGSLSLLGRIVDQRETSEMGWVASSDSTTRQPLGSNVSNLDGH
jgi:hypothetical protein